jgi:hypothetical protein|tara:strand:+ start:412 stop:1074 length:663 start_codon:yes stop_codon:yes gene_type:complete
MMSLMKIYTHERINAKPNLLKRRSPTRNFRRENKRMNKLIRNTLLALSIFVIGCEDNQEIYDDIDLVYNINLPIDENGYYHMELGDNWQTIERLTANLESKHLDSREYGERDLVETIKVYWESSHYWVMNDTLGYIVKRGLTDDMEYVNYDTLYIWGFEGESVPTINGASYPVNVDGDTWEVNTMAGPVSSMVGDTMTVWTYFWDLNYLYKEYSIGIIME